MNTHLYFRIQSTAPPLSKAAAEAASTVPQVQNTSIEDAVTVWQPKAVPECEVKRAACTYLTRYLGVCKELLIEDALLLWHPGPQLLLFCDVLNGVLHQRVAVPEQAPRPLVGAQHLIWHLRTHDGTCQSCDWSAGAVSLSHEKGIKGETMQTAQTIDTSTGACAYHKHAR